MPAQAAHSWIFARMSASLNKKYSCNTRTRHRSAPTTRRRHVKQAQTHLLSNLYWVAAPVREQNTVALLDGRRDDLAILVWRTGANSDDGRLREGVGRRRRGQEDTRGGFLLCSRSQTRDTSRKASVRTVSALNRWTRTRSKRGITALMDLNVAWAACRYVGQRGRRRRRTASGRAHHVYSK